MMPDSDFVFSRTLSDVPFVPLAWIDVTSYQDSEVQGRSVQGRSVRQTSLSEATLVPVLMGRCDALLIASWIADVPVTGQAPQRLRADLTSWDFGLRVERRAWKSLWVGGEAGVSGFRGFSFASGEWQPPKGSLGSDPYFVLTMTFRPDLTGTK